MEQTAGHERPYLPGMGRDALLPLYDPLVRLLGKRALDRRLVEQAGIAPGDRVLELGCGTGSVAILAQRTAPGAEVRGIDPDPKALARAGKKSRRADLAMRWDRGFAQELPYPDGSFDRVLSAMMLHHLDPGDRAASLREVRRVLAPGGSLHVVDFGGTHPDASSGRATSAHGRLRSRLTPHAHRPEDDGDSGIVRQLQEAGFTDAVEVERRPHRLLGSLTFCRATA